jgi:hypothetical protein
MKRLRRKVRKGGVGGVVHGNRGTKAWNKTASEKLDKVIELARGRYQGLNDTHLTEKLREKEEISLSRSVVRGILRGVGIAAVRKRGVKRHYKRRERKAQEGALVLWDGSPHRWFGEKLGEWTLMAVIDDATGALVCGVFAHEEDAQSYLICLRQMLLEKGIALAIYMDRHGIFRRNDEHWTLEEQLAGEQIPTQVGQALRALGIEPIFALSPQAKGRIERLFGTLQDRLVQELRLAGITTPEQATPFLNGSKLISMLGLPSRPSKAKQRGGLCPKESTWIGSAAFAMRPWWVTTMRCGWEESSWISPPARAAEATRNLELRCANSSMVAGACTTTTSCSWRQRLPRSRRR